MPDLNKMIVEFKLKIKQIKSQMKAAKAEEDWPTYNSLQKKLKHLEVQFERTKEMNDK